MDSDTMHLKKVVLLQELFHGRRRSSLVDVLGGEVIGQVQNLPGGLSLRRLTGRMI